MRRASEPGERTQTTVAELLARYGDAPPATGRRRRRAAEEPQAAQEPDYLQDTVAQPVVPSSWLDSTDSRRADSRRADSRGADGGEPVARSLGPVRGTERSSKRPSLSSLPDWAPAVGPPSITRKPAPASPSAAARPGPLTGPLAGLAASDGPATEQLPRYGSAAEPASSVSGRRSVGTQLLDPQPLSAAQPSSAQSLGSGSLGSQSLGSQPPAGLGTATRADAEQDEAAAAEPDPADGPVRSALWEWLAMVSQVGLGIVGGATLWLICEWLWQHIPVVALVVALAVITGLVWVVRRVRRAEDLQTTVIAVLVGLFVTVSPAALLLVGR